MKFILDCLGGALGPYILGAGAAITLGLGATVLMQRKDIAVSDGALAVCKLEKVGLVDKVLQQNKEVEDAHVLAAAEALAADLRVKNFLSKKRPPAPAGAKPEELNQWFAQRLSPSH